jgi:hypothetical protein
VGISAALFAVSAISGAKQEASAGKARQRAYEFDAKEAEIEATANITDRTRALNEAMAMQNAMMGGSGRTMDSLNGVMAGDRKRYEQDLALINTGTEVKSSQYRSAGETAKRTGYANATNTLLTSAYKYSMLGSGSSKPKDTEDEGK